MTQGRLEAIRSRVDTCLTKVSLTHEDHVAAHEDRVQLLVFVDLLVKAFTAADRVNASLRRKVERLQGAS